MQSSEMASGDGKVGPCGVKAVEERERERERKREREREKEREKRKSL